MAPYLSSPLLKYKLIFFLLSSMVTLSSCNNRTTYIVFMNPSLKPTPIQTHSLWYASHLESLSIDPSRHLLYSYSSLITAFAASLRPHHLPVLRSHPAVVLLFPEPVFWPLTTRTPLFLGLPTISPPPSLSSSSDVIVGVLDTGVWPESASFSDSGFSPIPSRWHGQCESAIDFPPSLCNRKLIGARSFSHGFRAASAEDPKQQESFSARDDDGHGTHTASTAVGSPASNASLLGYASGTARGMAPFARLAVYKVCWASGCFGSDILAAMEQSITDGVDVLSISLGGSPTTLSRDPIATGALAAIARGIFVSCSAGNSGPGLATLANTAPWIATIGAGTLDRDFPAYVGLGNGERYAGVSLSSGQGVSSKPVSVVYEKGSQSNTSKLCLSGSLNVTEVKGKVVFCDRGVSPRVEKGLVVKEAGGVGMILANTALNGEELVADSHLLPAVAVGVKEGDDIRKYLTSVSNPTAVLSFRGTVVDIRPSPVVAAFSSRGPSTVVPGILKPDLIGPGVNILAGWTGVVGPTGLEKDNRRSEFNILSGTSMSCPHISGVAALLKAAHPTWSPSAIKSALMTTAYVVDNTGSDFRDASGGSLATPLAYGSGYVNPQKALSPGLIYDATYDDYVAFLCLVEDNIKVVHSITQNPNITCSKKLANQGSLNYPSFSIVFNSKLRKALKYSRVVTNVGSPGSSYTVEVDGPASVGVVVEPAKLVFKKTGQKLRYTVSFTSKKGSGSAAKMEFGSITWNDGQHKVRSPVSYTWSSP